MPRLFSIAVAGSSRPDANFWRIGSGGGTASWPSGDAGFVPTLEIAVGVACAKPGKGTHP